MKYTTSIVIAAVNTGHSFFFGEHTKREGKDTLESKKSHSVGETLPGAVFLGYVPLNQVWRFHQKSQRVVYHQYHNKYELSPHLKQRYLSYYSLDTTK